MSSEKRLYTCLKDWEIDSGVYYQKGEEYWGKPVKGGKGVLVTGDCHMKVTFHKGSEYFNIEGELG